MHEFIKLFILSSLLSYMPDACGGGAGTGGEPPQQQQPENTAALCSDLADNDADGAADCADADCSSFCSAPAEICADGADNDRDGATDCDDTDCAEACLPPVEICGDGADNDRDGSSDCDDQECATSPACTTYPSTCATMTDTPVTVNVLLLIYNPVIESEGGRKLTEVMGWSDPDQLTYTLVDDVREASCGFVNYDIVERIEVDGYPVKKDGFMYSDDTFMRCLRDADRSDCHMPDEIDYNALFERHSISDKVARGTVREVWLWGAPYFGWDEYAGKIPADRPYSHQNCLRPEAYWFYRPKNIPDLGSTVWVMGFSYERLEGEMLESYGHRIEGTLSITIADCMWTSTGSDPWSMFTWIDKNMPGRAQCGGMHYAPNSLSDYDWANQRFVQSACDDWSSYPSLPGGYRSINCGEWGCSDSGYKKWWMSHLPHSAGSSSGAQNNWWKYVVDLDRSGW